MARLRIKRVVRGDTAPGISMPRARVRRPPYQDAFLRQRCRWRWRIGVGVMARAWWRAADGGRNPSIMDNGVRITIYCSGENVKYGGLRAWRVIS